MGSPSDSSREREGNLLGRAALDRGLITADQLREALVEQARDIQAGRPIPRKIGSILVTKGYLTDRQLDLLLGAQKEKRTAAPPPRPATPPPLPETIGKYKVIREVGRGAMGVVYETVDTALNRKVALKRLRSVPGADPGETAREEERFLKEARLCASVAKHPHIVSIYETAEIEGRRYIAMEYVEGRQMSDWRKAGPPSLRHQVRLLRDVALAVHHAHQEGLIHRDLKPANVLVDSKNAPHITDFGLARSVSRDAPLSAVAAGEVAGTPLYMSPEQARGHSNIGRSADIYPLGVMLYEMITGRTPFRGESRQEIVVKLLGDPVPPPSSVVRPVGVPPPDPALERICLKALEKNPRDRYPTAQEFADELSRWLKGEEPAAAPRRADRKRLILAAAGAGLVAVLVLGFILTRPAGSSEADRLARTARKMTDSGAFREAWELYLRAALENPSDSGILAGKKIAERDYLDSLDSQAARLAAQGRYDDAEDLFRPFLDRVPDHPRAIEGMEKVQRRKIEARLAEAERLIAGGNGDEALMVIGVILNEQPAHPKALELKAKARKGTSGAAPAPPPPEKDQPGADGWTPLLSGPRAAAWKTIQGKAIVEDEVLILRDGAEVMQKINSPNFELRGRVMVSGKPSQGCIAVRRAGLARGTPTRLQFNYDGDIHLVDAGLRDKTGPAGFRPAEWNPFVLTVRDGEISLAIRGRIALKGPLTTPGAGNLALYSTGAGMTVSFTDLQLREIR
jgi:tetratricopeptide (TPR) repeat protein/predicted Ser/Thr protein kinase